MFGLTPYSSDDEVRLVLTEQGVRLKPSIGGDPYPVDWHYEMFVLDSINTLEDALAFCDRLDAECNAHKANKTGCTKANQIRSWLHDEKWYRTPERIRAAISANRTVTCWSHARYCFALRKEYRAEK